MICHLKFIASLKILMYNYKKMNFGAKNEII